jgi:uncharacterized ferritin-like protein (DUF455 family)
MTAQYLPGIKRGEYMRYDTAVILKRFFLIEQEMIIGQAGWLPAIPYFEMKTLFPKMLWEDAMTGNMLRERVYELRFPSRMLEIGTDLPIVDFLRSCYHAPNAIALLMVISRIVKPAIRNAYQTYLHFADDIGDGPTYRFLMLAVEEKGRHIEIIENFISMIIADEKVDDIKEADKWLKQQDDLLRKIGGISLNAPNAITVDQAEKRYEPFEIPSRESSFQRVRFYWPDIVDSDYPYGNGLQLQIRSAVSHFNEVWAVEMAGFVLYTFAPEFEWEFVYDAARWVYDESRHVRMGYSRLVSWGFEDIDLPLGSYIYDSCKGQDAIYRLGMLFYFESKNIGKKLDRIKNFEKMNDRMSQHDMDFDWADETIHTGYGKRWLSEALKNRGMNPDDYTKVKIECERLVAEVLETVNENEIKEIKQIAQNMYEKASKR